MAGRVSIGKSACQALRKPDSKEAKKKINFLTAMCAVAHAMALYARFASIFLTVDEHTPG